MKKLYSWKKGFTLTEVLLATAIVGIIAALVMPAIVTHLNDQTMQYKLERTKSSIQASLDYLAVSENQTDFGKTSMFVGSPNYNPEEFIKKYLKVSKYIGTGNPVPECFADKYYEYSGNDKKEVSISGYYSGYCALLKDGACVCLNPQPSRSEGVSGTIDVNGPKPPNIIGRDLLTDDAFKLSPVVFEATTDLNRTSMQGVATTVGGLEPASECSSSDKDSFCCNKRADEGQITSQTDVCCDLGGDIIKKAPICAKEITLVLNYYPTTSCTFKEWSEFKCQPEVKKSGTSAKSGSIQLSELPVAPPTIYVNCSGYRAGEMPGSSLTGLLKNDPSGHSLVSTFFLRTGSGVPNSASCKYSGITVGLTSTDGSLTFSNNSANIVWNGIKWTVEKH